MKIAVAQLKSVQGDIPENIEAHKRMIEMAVNRQVDALFFPELSITGYEPELAEELATDLNDARFDELEQTSHTHQITISIGMPLRTSSGIQIGLIVLQPNKHRESYSKQLLHADELPYFTAGDKQMLLHIAGEKLAPAICYESLQPEHAEQASKLGATIYIASVAKSQNGINKAMEHFPTIAKRWSLPVLMANAVGPADNFISAGRSAVWNHEGKLLQQLDSTTEGLLIFDTQTSEMFLGNKSSA